MKGFLSEAPPPPMSIRPRLHEDHGRRRCLSETSLLIKEEDAFIHDKRCGSLGSTAHSAKTTNGLKLRWSWLVSKFSFGSKINDCEDYRLFPIKGSDNLFNLHSPKDI